MMIGHFQKYKPSWVLLLGLFLAPRAYSQDFFSANLPAREARAAVATSSLEKNLKPLTDVLEELRQLHSTTFLYERKNVAGKFVDANVQIQSKVESTLDLVLPPINLTYEKINDRTFAILARPATHPDGIPPRRSALPDPARTEGERPADGLVTAGLNRPATIRYTSRHLADFAITGRVTDDRGQGLPGVSVVLKGSVVGVTTSSNGNYALNVPDGSGTLVFSYIGFTSREEPINNRNVIDLTLVPDVKGLGEVVVVGYGTQERRNVTGSVATVSAKELQAVPVNTFEQALQGRAAGVQVTTANGAPGGSVQIRIRGTGSVTQSSDPLYVIDGLPIFGDDFTSGGSIAGQGGSGAGVTPGSVLASINPNDIESIEILKDASATAIYGSRGANGVVMITTKRGQAGRTNINVDSYYGLQHAPNLIPMLNGAQYAAFVNDARLNNGQAIHAIHANPYAFGKGTDWQKEVFRVAPMQNHSLSVSGGNIKTQFALSAGYFKQEGIIINTDFQRYSFRANLDHQATDRLRVGMSLAPSFQHGNFLNTDNVFGGRLLGALRTTPILPVYAPDGTYAGRPQNVPGYAESRNLVSEFNRDVNDMRRARLLGNLYAEYRFFNNLTFRSTFGADGMYTKQFFFDPIYQLYGGEARNDAHMRILHNDYLNWNTDQTLTYQATVRERHALNAMIGFNAQSFVNNDLYGDKDQIISNNLRTLSNAPRVRGFSGGGSATGLVSYFTRVNYAFADKYLVTATVRRDGSSRFGPGNKWGTFPSASVGWRISQEDFMTGFPLLQDLKVRVSYGLTGNQNIGNYAYLARAANTDYGWGNGVATGISPISFRNDNLQWETNRQLDIGTDFSVLNGRVSFVADYFIRTSEDLLIDIPLPGSAGAASSQTVNLGSVQNKGFEFAVNSNNLVGTFRWTTDLNLTFIRNMVTDLGVNPAGGKNEYFGGAPFNIGTLSLTREGHPLGSFYTYVYDGIYQTEEEVAAFPRPGARAGDVRYKDVNGDGVFTDADRTFTGQAQPKFFGGLNNTFEFMNFSLNVFLNWQTGNMIYNGGRVYGQRQDGFWNNRAEVNNRWTPLNPSTEVPRAGGNPGQNTLPSTRFLEDGSFLRVRNISLSYNIPSALSQRIGMQNTRIYASVANALTFTRYSGYDPEVNSLAGNPLAQGIDLIGYPLPRVFTMGVNLTF